MFGCKHNVAPATKQERETPSETHSPLYLDLMLLEVFHVRVRVEAEEVINRHLI
jgi:hypothetical protein